ncbi:hypothetical protein ASD89_22375 [Caulobacter sp. Root656]|nr:hypothetical protein ASD89_22375 [Caulobacter sp. Root656]
MKRGGTVVLAVIGSLGDLFPFIALAKVLRDRGHRPVIASHALHRPYVEAEGLTFRRLRPDDDDLTRRLGLDMGQMFQRMARDPAFLLRELTFPFLPIAYEDALAATADADLVVAHNMAFAALLAAETRSLPLVRVVLAPVMLQSAGDPSLTPPAPYVLAPRGPGAKTWNRLVRALVRRSLADMTRPIRTFRPDLGLAPNGDDYFFDFGRPDRSAAVIGLYPQVFAPVQADHPVNLLLAGFPTYDGDGAPDPALESFLTNGPPPIVFSLGSFAVHAPGDFYLASLEAARALGRRAVLLAGAVEAERLGRDLGPDILVAAYARHSHLFPRAAAVVHHGGIGTTAQVLRAGKPQLVVPFLGDQPDNGARLVRMGVARVLPPARYDVRRAQGALADLLGRTSYATTAQALASTFAANGAMVAADRLEQLL